MKSFTDYMEWEKYHRHPRYRFWHWMMAIKAFPQIHVRSVQKQTFNLKLTFNSASISAEVLPAAHMRNTKPNFSLYRALHSESSCTGQVDILIQRQTSRFKSSKWKHLPCPPMEWWYTKTSIWFVCFHKMYHEEEGTDYKNVKTEVATNSFCPQVTTTKNPKM